MTLIEQLKRTKLNLLTVELELNEFVIEYDDEYIREDMEVIECLKCKDGIARLVTTTSVEKVIIPNGTNLNLADYLVMEDFEMRAFEILYEAGKLRATYITTDDDNDGVLELRRYDINTHGYFEVMTNDKVDKNWYNEDGSIYEEVPITARAYDRLEDMPTDMMKDNKWYNEEDATMVDEPTFEVNEVESIKYDDLPTMVLTKDSNGNLRELKRGFTLRHTLFLLVGFIGLYLVLAKLSIVNKITIPELSHILTYENNNNNEVGDVNAVGGNLILGR